MVQRIKMINNRALHMHYAALKIYVNKQQLKYILL